MIHCCGGVKIAARRAGGTGARETVVEITEDQLVPMGFPMADEPEFFDLAQHTEDHGLQARLRLDSRFSNARPSASSHSSMPGRTLIDGTVDLTLPPYALSMTPAPEPGNAAEGEGGQCAGQGDQQQDKEDQVQQADHDPRDRHASATAAVPADLD